MGITLERENGTYKVHDLFVEHNHILQTAQTSRLMPLQRNISKHQAVEIEVADDSGIGPKAAHEFLGRYDGRSANLGYTHRDHKNYLQTKRQRDMLYGEAGCLLKYFQDKVVENPSFQYAMQMDCEEQIVNIFWADAKMIIDYAHFGDVITFNTTFGTNKEYRPFVMFVGFNQFRETVVFGVALMYDETFDSFKWLFNAFLSTHKQKQPQTIFTDQDIAMGKAVFEVFTSTWHGLCTWHISQNAIKHLSSLKEEGSSILSDFSSCMYEYEQKPEFEEAFDAMRRKVSKTTWLDSIYMLKDKWAEWYMLDIFSLGMRSTQLSESLNNALKGHLKSNLDISRFLKRVELVIADKREKELQAEFESRKKQPRIGMMAPMLIQASMIYTPAIFEVFKGEYEKYLAAYTIGSNGTNEFVIAIGALEETFTLEEERTVIVNPVDQMVSCSCRLVERIGILCRHALKALDLVNIKLLPKRYILKRWTRGARSGIIQDMHGRDIVENPKLNATLRYKNLCKRFLPLASRAADFEECYLFVEEALHSMSKQVEEKNQR
ncbi:protein FAR1-RELATED SEQUENCE 5-like [Phragmites australis]|uniref:protein FAR1-RELATED SEQUENCE 5-like n=1 Tax=Phragmites australis TaxID=29695 RepID=UPI002D781D15|nr:protein FAR1-RELATED SEQUENCE 5-like [Phragmites australis]